jgi:peptide/nickel transport system substrate-binding protein
VRVLTGKSLIAGVAVLALGLTACSSSKSNSKNSAAPSGGTGKSSSNNGNGNTSATAGTKGVGAFSDCATKPNDCNTGTAKQGGTVVYTIEKTVAGWNINFSTSNVFDIAETMNGIMPAVYLVKPDLKPYLNSDLMESVNSTVAGDVQTIVYKVKKEAVWNDGKPIDFSDFEYMKKTSDGSTCPKCGPSSTAGYDQIKSMTSSDGGKTITVKLTPYADWQGMFGTLMPAHIAAQHGDLKTAAGINQSFQWFDKNVPTWSGGPMVISDYKKDTSITETPNPKWYGATKSKLNSIIFRIITDQTQEAPALQNHEVNAIYPQPNTDLLRQVQSLQGQGVQYYIGKGLVWEHFDFNEKNQFLKDKTLRTAIFTAINRKDIIARTIGQFVPNPQPLGNHMYVQGQAGYQDNVTPTGQGNGDIAKAKQLLQSAGYTGVGSALKTKDGKAVAFRCTYSAGNAYRQTECETVQNTLKQLGINVTLKTTQDLSELGTGNFDMIVFAWVGTPFATTNAVQTYTLKGGGDYGFNNNPQAEALLKQAGQQTDPKKVQDLLNQADKLIMADAYELPLYQKPTMLAADNTVVNLRDNATSVGPTYNLQEWGVKAA